MKANRLLSFYAALLLGAGSGGAFADTYKAPHLLLVVEQSSGDKSSFCLDSMETVPFSDDLEPTLISVDGGCSVAEGTIAI